MRADYSWLRGGVPFSGFIFFLLAQKTGYISVISMSQPPSSSHQLGPSEGREVAAGNFQCTIRSAVTEEQLEADEAYPCLEPSRGSSGANPGFYPVAFGL